jgi:hypothetical protein
MKMYFRRCGLNIVTSAIVCSALVWRLIYPKKHFDNFIISYLFILATGHPVLKPTPV